MTEEIIPLLSEDTEISNCKELPTELWEKILFTIPELYYNTVQVCKSFFCLNQKINYCRAAHIFLDQIMNLQSQQYWITDILRYDSLIDAAYTSDLDMWPTTQLSKNPLYRYSPMYKWYSPKNPALPFRNLKPPGCMPTLAVSICRDQCIVSLLGILIISLILFVTLVTIPRYRVQYDKLLTDPINTTAFRETIKDTHDCIIGRIIMREPAGPGLSQILSSLNTTLHDHQLTELLNSETEKIEFANYLNITNVWATDAGNSVCTTKLKLFERYDILYHSQIEIYLKIYIYRDEPGLIRINGYHHSLSCLINKAKTNIDLVLSVQVVPILFIIILLIIVFIYNCYLYIHHQL